MNEKEVREAIRGFSTMSNDQLVAKLAEYMAGQKAKDGGAQMMKTIERIKPLLNAEQRKRLEEILASAGATGTQ